LRFTAAAASVSASSKRCAGNVPWPSFSNLAHRLDRETSGILLVGKKRLALVALHDMFREHGAGADKRYLVLVKGRWMNSTQHVKLPLHKYLTEGGERRVSVNPEGKASHTVFRLLARWPEMSLLEAQLKDRAHAPDSRPSGASRFPDSRR
jgi:23S rRNA pseudouridine955/2504/2580 synthase